MSFFRNLRSSITRGRSSSRDTTPVRTSRPGSVISGMGKRRDSVESNTDSIFQRSDTFILDEPVESGLNSNTSTLEKKSKKSKVLEKFSTFTKRKKTPTPDSSAYEHHPSDNATNTYYKWQADGGNSLDYDSHTDPFNFLYDQSSLKSLHNAASGSESMRSVQTPLFDSSTYRKGKMPKELKQQLDQLKQSQNLPEHDGVHNHSEEEEEESKLDESDKYKTVTLNSLRKSFRDKFMQHQKEEPHNPAWFVEVEPPPAKPQGERDEWSAKENRPDFLVFDNDNYRPGSRSPITDLNSRRPARSATRSPVKRNEIFKVDRNVSASGRNLETQPSIKIEFKNSITPNLPGRMVPIGVAKPMPSQISSTPYYGRSESSAMNSSYTLKSSSSTRLNSHQSPLRNWSKPFARSPSRPAVNVNTQRNEISQHSGRYQTLVQIKDNSNGLHRVPHALAFTSRPSRLSTRIQLGGPSTGLSTAMNPVPLSPAFATRYQTQPKAQQLKQTYFGDTHYPGAPLTSARLVQSRTFCQKISAPAFTSKHQTPQHYATGSNSHTTLTTAQTRSTPSYAFNNNNSHNGISSLSYLKHQQQQPSRFTVPSQRRSRSPIKIPWR